jgi:hypothetical protein
MKNYSSKTEYYTPKTEHYAPKTEHYTPKTEYNTPKTEYNTPKTEHYYKNPVYFPKVITNSQNLVKWRVDALQMLKTIDCDFKLVGDNIHIMSDFLFEEIIFKIAPTDEERVNFADGSVLTEHIRKRFLFIEREKEKNGVERWHFTNDISIILKADKIERDYFFEISSINPQIDSRDSHDYRDYKNIKVIEIIYTKNGSEKFYYETKTNNIDTFINIIEDNNLVSVHRDNDYYVRFDYNNEFIMFNRVI